MKMTVLRYILLAAVSVGLSSHALSAGDVLKLKDGHPQKHVVVKGDTLWDISAKFLDDPWMWPEIWHVNPQVDNPHLIYPGDVLNLVWMDGQPKLVVKRGQDIKFSPHDVKLNPQVRISDLNRAIPAIPLDAIAPFLSESRVVDADKLTSTPYVLAGADGHIVSGAGDVLYARGSFDEDNQTYGIYRPGKPYLDPETEETLGYQAVYIASAKVTAVEGEVATIALNQTTEEVRRGDRLLPDEGRKISSSFLPKAPEADTTGYIIAVEGGVSQVGSMDVVVINKGQRDGLEIGNVLAIYRVGEQVRDPITGEIVKVPDNRAGLMMVFRAFDKVSYGLVLKATRTLSVMDKVKNP